MALLGNLINKKVLITCGPTWVALDNVRVISNISTGELGLLVAKKCLQSGAKVTMLLGPVRTIKPLGRIKVINYRFFDELNSLLRRELKKKYDVVVHAAAVSDYQPKVISAKKISSNLKQLKVALVPTVKLINRIKKLAPKTKLIGFKLTDSLGSGSILPKVKKLFEEAGCDLVAANSLNSGKYRGVIVGPNLKFIAEASSRPAMAEKLVKIIRSI